jgi:hypothetical protein
MSAAPAASMRSWLIGQGMRPNGGAAPAHSTTQLSIRPADAALCGDAHNPPGHRAHHVTSRSRIMNVMPKSTESSGYPVKTIVRVVVVAAVGAVIYSAVFSQSRPTATGNSHGGVVASAQAAVQVQAGWPSPSSTATEGNVVDLTFPQF